MGAKRKRLDDYIIDKYVEIPLDSIDPDKTNVREDYTFGELESLARSMAGNAGQMTPAVLEKKGKKYTLVAGNRRYFAAKLARQKRWTNVETLRARTTRPLPEELRLKVQRYENDCKKAVPTWKIADSLWGRYKISLADGFQEQEIIDQIHEAQDFYEIPEAIRSKLPINRFAEMVGRSSSTVSQAFKYQKTHQNIKRAVQKGEISYGVACTLASVPNKNEQRRLFRSWTENGKLTQEDTRKKVKAYLEELAKGDHFELVIESETEARRPLILKQLSEYLSKTERFFKMFEGIAKIDRGIWRMCLKHNGEDITPRTVLNKANGLVGKLHDKFLEEEDYKKRWEYKPRKTTLAEMVIDIDAKDGKSKKRLMDFARYEEVPKDKIRPNPINPRGGTEDFDQAEKEILKDSIEDVGLIHPILLMKTGKSYVALEGHRRTAALLETDYKKVPSLVIPVKLTENQQLTLMYDADIFEEVNIHDRAKAIARQFRLAKKRDKKLTADQFCEQNAKWGKTLVRDAISYDSLPRELQRFYTDKLITYRVAVDLAEIKDRELQKATAISAVVLKQSHEEVKRATVQDNQATLMSQKQLDEMRRDGIRRELLHQMRSNLSGIREILEKIDESTILHDTPTRNKFQGLVRTLQAA